MFAQNVIHTLAMLALGTACYAIYCTVRLASKESNNERLQWLGRTIMAIAIGLTCGAAAWHLNEHLAIVNSLGEFKMGTAYIRTAEKQVDDNWIVSAHPEGGAEGEVVSQLMDHVPPHRFIPYQLTDGEIVYQAVSEGDQIVTLPASEPRVDGFASDEAYIVWLELQNYLIQHDEQYVSAFRGENSAAKITDHVWISYWGPDTDDSGQTTLLIADNGKDENHVRIFRQPVKLYPYPKLGSTFYGKTDLSGVRLSDEVGTIFLIKATKDQLEFAHQP